tara:strand:+ start:316 stop:708 length:393 start_codon:yes stop_codon:yes gene_type:complete
MNRINPNSFEAITLYVIYICFQDGDISTEEVEELSNQSAILKNFYFECYGEVCDLEIGKVAVEMRQFLKDNFDPFTEKINEKELSFFEELITDSKLKNIALLAAKLSASKDGLHAAEEAKWNYWLNRWMK